MIELPASGFAGKMKSPEVARVLFYGTNDLTQNDHGPFA